MANFSDLPSEIWFLIAQYISTSELSKLKWLNSFFFHHWMDHQWKEVFVRISNFDSKRPFRLLRGLILPFVAPRTKMMSVVLVPTNLTTHDVTFTGALVTLLHSLTLLPNLTSLNIHYATPHLVNFFQTIASSSLKRTLQHLLLTGHVEMFASIQEYCAQKSLFDNLIKLELELHAFGGDGDPRLESSLALEPFLRSLGPTLQSLVITNQSFTLDLSPLFNGLSKHDSPVLFPNLISFSIHLHFNTSFRTSPQSLRNFLRINNHLQHLRLDMSFHFPYQEDKEPLGAWLADLVNENVHFPSLQTLDIYPSDTQTGLSALPNLIKRTASTLSSLIVSGCFSPRTVNQVIDALAECEGSPRMLKSLNLNTTELSVPLLELLARKLPQLEKLTLSTILFVGSGQYSFHDMLRERRYNRDSISTQDVFHAWKLRDLKIYQKDWELNEDAIGAVSGAIPALAHLRRQVG